MKHYFWASLKKSKKRWALSISSYRKITLKNMRCLLIDQQLSCYSFFMVEFFTINGISFDHQWNSEGNLKKKLLGKLKVMPNLEQKTLWRSTSFMETPRKKTPKTDRATFQIVIISNDWYSQNSRSAQVFGFIKR
jgi:hypothetical protein